MSIVGRSSGFGVIRRVSPSRKDSLGADYSGFGVTRCRPLRRRNRGGIEESPLSSHLASLLSLLAQNRQQRTIQWSKRTGCKATKIFGIVRKEMCTSRKEQSNNAACGEQVRYYFFFADAS